MGWYSDWTYRKQVTLTGRAGSGTGYQVKLLVGESAGAAGANFHVAGNAVAFPSAENTSGDLRFTQSDGSSLLDFYVETVTGSTPNRLATIWVEVAESLESNLNIFCYYGKTGTSNVSSGDNTFLFFDDASGTYADKWTTKAGTGSYGTYNGKTAIKLEAAATDLLSTYSLPTAFAIEAQVYTTNNILHIQYYSDNTPTANEKYNARFDGRAGQKEGIIKDGGFIGANSDVYSGTSWVKTLITLVGGTHVFKIGTTTVVSTSDTAHTSGYLSLTNQVTGNDGVAQLFVRKFIATEPAFSSVTAQVTNYKLTGVIAKDSVGVVGATLYLFNETDETYVAKTTSGADGSFEFDDLFITKTYHIFVKYNDGAIKYNAASCWSLTPATRY